MEVASPNWQNRSPITIIIHSKKNRKKDYQLQVRIRLLYENHNLTDKRLEICYIWRKTDMLTF